MASFLRRADSDDDMHPTRRSYPANSGGGAGLNPLSVVPLTLADDEPDVATRALSKASNERPLVKRSSSCLSNVPNELLILVAEFLRGLDLFNIRLIDRRFAALWDANAYDLFRPFLQPWPRTWTHRYEQGSASRASFDRLISYQQVESLRILSRVSRVVRLAARWLRNGIHIPNELRFGTLTLDLPAASPSVHQPAMTEEMQDVRQVVVDREDADLEEPDAAAPIHDGVPSESRLTPEPGRAAASNSVKSADSPPLMEAVVDECPDTKYHRKQLKRWLREMRRYWLCRRNILHGLCNMSVVERHSHAMPILLPNGTVCFSRWQMLSCFVRFEKHRRRRVSGGEWGAEGQRGCKKKEPTCKGDPDSSVWGRTGHIASHRDTITVIRYHAPSESILTASLDGTVKVWKPRAVNEAPPLSHAGVPLHAAASSSASDSDEECEVRATAKSDGACAEPSVLPFRKMDRARGLPEDETWLVCLSTFDVASAALTVPRCGVFSIDVLELEGFFGERCLSPLLALGMESGHVVVVSCTPGDWQVVDVHYTGDMRAQAIRFINHVPFAPSLLLSRFFKAKASETVTESMSKSLGRREKIDGMLSSVSYDPCHPYTLKQVTSEEYHAHDRIMPLSPGTDASIDPEPGSLSGSRFPLDGAQRDLGSTTSSDFFIETGVVHLCVITLSAAMVIEFQIDRSMELLAFDEGDEVSDAQRQLLRFVRTDGVSNGLLLPSRRTPKNIRPTKYSLTPCDVSSVSRLFAMSLSDVVGVDVPSICHSLQFPLACATHRNEPDSNASESLAAVNPLGRLTARQPSLVTGPAESENSDTERELRSPNFMVPTDPGGVRLPSPLLPIDAAPLRDVSAVSNTATAGDFGSESGAADHQARVTRMRTSARSLPVFSPLVIEREPSLSTTRAQCAPSVCAVSEVLGYRPYHSFFADRRVAAAPWHGNPFFLTPLVVLVTAEGRAVLITKRTVGDSVAADVSEANRRNLYRLDALYPHAAQAQFSCCRISPSSGLIAAGFDDGTLRLYIRVACLGSSSDASRFPLLFPRPWSRVMFPEGDDPVTMFGPVHETDSTAQNLACILNPLLLSGSGLTDGMVSLRLYPAHHSSVCSVHVDSWKLTSVDALSTVHVIDLRTLRLLWVISQRPHPFGPVSSSLKDRAVALDSASHSYVIRQVQWFNESLLVSPLGITKHAFVAHFGGKFARGVVPRRKDPFVLASDVTVRDGEVAPDWLSHIRSHRVVGAFSSRSFSQHRQRPVTSTDARPADPFMRGEDDDDDGRGNKSEDCHLVADSTRSGMHTFVCDTSPFNAMRVAAAGGPPGTTTLLDNARPVRVIFAEPGALTAHALHILGFPLTLIMIAIFATLVSLRLDGYLVGLSWWVILVPHLIMIPDYAALNYLAYNRRSIQQSGFPFIARVVVDFMYVVVFPFLYVCRVERYFYPFFTSLSWLYISLPLNLSVLINLLASIVERRRDAALRLQATDSTVTSRGIVSVIDIFQTLMAMWLISALSIYFDTPPSDPEYPLASDYATPNLSIFTAVVPLWCAIGVIMVILPRMPSLNRTVGSMRTLIALTLSYLGVLIFGVAPLVLFCVKYNNYYDYTHNNSSTVIQSTSTVPAIGKIPLVIIIIPALIVVLMAFALAVSNVANHYHRLTRGSTARGRAR